jgi:hypothetical protein
MHSLRLTPVALALCLSVAGAQNLDDYKISLCIDGTPVKGMQELWPLEKAASTPGAVFDANPPMQLSPGQSVQAFVKVTDPSGVTRDYTRNPRLRYEPVCMTASSRGMLTMTPMTGVPCAGPGFPGLAIFLTDASGNAIGANSYMFQLVDPGQAALAKAERQRRPNRC